MSKTKPKAEKFIFSLHVDLNLLKTEFDFLKVKNQQSFEKHVTFLDEQKTKHHGKISTAQGDGLYCFWDRHPFSWKGVACPLRKDYTAKHITYESKINGSKYVISDVLSVTDGVYRTVDHFCSTECCLAFIEDNPKDPKFVDSKNLLFEISGKSCNAAPSWRLLNPYGGCLTIEQFREQFCNKTFVLEGVITKPLYFVYRESYHLQ
jgi:hypothetical protein